MLYGIALSQAAVDTVHFHDIVTGDNHSVDCPDQFEAVEGYDLCTGWGSARPALLDALFLSPLSSVILHPREPARVLPNPTTGRCQVQFRNMPPGLVDVSIVDPVGRVVRKLRHRVSPAGDFSVTWDGHDDRGRTMPEGVYFARVRTAAAERAEKVVILR